MPWADESDHQHNSNLIMVLQQRFRPADRQSNIRPHGYTRLSEGSRDKYWRLETSADKQQVMYDEDEKG